MAFRIGIDARKLNDFGIGTYIRNLIESLTEIDRQNRYFLIVGLESQAYAGLEHQELLDVLPDNFELVAERSPVYSARELVAVSWLIKRLRLDLYHATHYVLPAYVGCPSVVTIHDIIHLLYPEFLPGPLAFFYAQRMIRRSLTRGDCILADSQNTRTDLMEYFEVDGGKIDVIYPGVAERYFERLQDDELSRRLSALGLPSPYLLFVGNPKPHKNLDNVVKAYARALELEEFDADLVCVGDRGGRDFKIRQRAEQLGIGRRVRLLGHVGKDDLTALYQGATLFLYPTLYEGFGLPVVEAMASGVAVITSNNSALKEVAEGHAHLVDPLDVEEIARSISHCMADAEHREALAKLGLDRARDFRWDVAARKTFEIYERLLPGNGRAGG